MDLGLLRCPNLVCLELFDVQSMLQNNFVLQNIFYIELQVSRSPWSIIDIFVLQITSQIPGPEC